MKAEQITIGVSPMTKTVFAGRLNKGKNMWLEKADVTDMFFACVIEKFVGTIETVEYENGDVYEITVKKINPAKRSSFL